MKFPFVSVIIPTYNEEKYIRKCLEAWVNQDYPKDRYEILIFDGMSTDRTVEIVREIQRKNPKLIKLFKNEKRRQVFAFNEGIKKAKGDFFVIFGAHAYPKRDFLKRSVKVFLEARKEEPKLAGVGGKIVKLHENGLARIVALIYSSPLSGASSFHYRKERHFAKTVAFALYDKEIAIRAGGFDEDMIVGDDFEFNLRLNKLGYKLLFDPTIVSYYFTRCELRKFLIQTFNYGAVKGVSIRKGYFSPLWLLIPLLIGCEAFLFFYKPLIWLFILYFAILVGEGVRLWKETKRADSLLLPFAMWLFHNLIALGFIAGLIVGKKAFR